MPVSRLGRQAMCIFEMQATALASEENIVGRPPGYTGFTIRALPTLSNASTGRVSGKAACG
jgi:hypothetical protein